MEHDEVATPNLSGRTILIADADPIHSELATELQRFGGRVIRLPKIESAEADDYTPLDEAVANLYGYDWLIFINPLTVEFFLRRFKQLGHAICELDTLRVCAIGEPTLRRIEACHVHVDLVAPVTSREIVIAFENYLGGRESLRGLNFLIAKSSAAGDSLLCALADVGARADRVTTHRIGHGNNPELTRINTLLAGGAIDCIVFTSPAAVMQCAEVFGTNDLSPLLKDVAVACADQATAQAVIEFGLHAQIKPVETTIPELSHAIANHLSTPPGEACANIDLAGSPE